MAVRKRFNPAERALLVKGASIEWRNGSHWHPATVTGEITRDHDGWESCMLENHAHTPTLAAGMPITGSPGHVRASSYVGPSGRTPTPVR